MTPRRFSTRRPAARAVRAALAMYAPARDPVAGVLARLSGVRPAGDGRWIARCPAHRDDRPSLSVARGRDGDCLLHCFAGCDTSDVLAALGLRWRDLLHTRGGQS